ncbi:O-antigen ligase family protein [Brevundimonas nasdae]|uniref:O-antigen ligase family protein n=1 Tax=Brevundimonas nasdae TaxID=172043 RepID=UPI0012EEA76A|nr:O-antigen ligase family protein [Brevundimonas nasdae]
MIGVLAMVSAIWSAEPGVSGRFGLQLLLTIGVGAILVVTCPPERLLRGLFLACALVLVLSILSGRQGQSLSGPVLIGLLGSKNEMGTLCFLLLGAAASVGVSEAQPRPLRLLSAPIAALAALYLVKAFSTGAVVDVLHKDAGLTGRDYLWAHADALIGAEPLLGHGYRSTWLGHGVDTIGLLRWAGLQSGEGFSFHNSYREWLVDFGFVGAGLIVLALGVGIIRTLIRASQQGVTAAQLFFASIGVVFAVRAYFEYVFGPFSSSTILVVVVAGFGYLGARTLAGAPTGIGLPNRAVQERFVQ